MPTLLAEGCEGAALPAFFDGKAEAKRSPQQPDPAH